MGYTSDEVMRRRKGGPIDADARLDAGRKLKAMYRSLGMDLAACAQFLQVSERTLHNWQSGRHVVPFAVFKLLRLLNRMDLPGPTWDGWYFVGGKLVTPEGRVIVGTDASWWGLLVRKAALFGDLYARSIVVERAMKAKALGDGAAPASAGAAPAHGAEVSDSEPARSAGRNLLIGELRTSNFRNGVVPDADAAKGVATLAPMSVAANERWK